MNKILKDKRFICIAIFIVVIVLDQISKIWVKTHLALGSSIWIADWFQINFQENNGMAFSIEMGPKVFLTLFRIVAVGGLIYIIRKLIKEGYKTGFIACMTLITAGALGNIIDCVFYGVIFSDSHRQIAEFMPAAGGYGTWLNGKVVDMLYFPLCRLPEWVPFFGGDIFFRPVFNIADSAVCTGVFCTLVFQHKELSRFMGEEKNENADENKNKGKSNPVETDSKSESDEKK